MLPGVPEKNGCGRDIHVQFFTDQFRLRNNTGQPQNYVLFRRQLPEEPLKGVTINGDLADYVQEADALRISLSLNQGQAADVKVERGTFDPVSLSLKPERTDNTRVFIRRRLSEFRDNYVDRNRVLSRLASCVRHFLAR